MPYYLAEPVVRRLGRRDARFPAGYDLVPDAARNWLWCGDRIFLWTLTPVVDPRLTLLADDRGETAARATKLAVEALAKDREFADGMTFADMVADLYMRPGAATKGVGLLSDKRDQRFKLHLGPGPERLFWSADDPVKRSSTVEYEDTFAGNGNLNGRSFTTGSSTWEEHDGTILATSGGELVASSMGAGVFAGGRSSASTDGDDVYAEFDITTMTATGNISMFVDTRVLMNSDSSNFLALAIRRRTGASDYYRNLVRWVDPNYDVLENSNTQADTGLYYVEVSGSSMAGKFAGSTILGPVNHGYTTGSTKRRGGVFVENEFATGNFAATRFKFGDIAAGAKAPPPRRRRTYFFRRAA